MVECIEVGCIVKECGLEILERERMGIKVKCRIGVVERPERGFYFFKIFFKF